MNRLKILIKMLSKNKMLNNKNKKKNQKMNYLKKILKWSMTHVQIKLNKTNFIRMLIKPIQSI